MKEIDEINKKLLLQIQENNIFKEKIEKEISLQESNYVGKYYCKHETFGNYYIKVLKIKHNITGIYTKSFFLSIECLIIKMQVRQLAYDSILLDDFKKSNKKEITEKDFMDTIKSTFPELILKP
jgi:hypothetical protein